MEEKYKSDIVNTTAGHCMAQYIVIQLGKALDSDGRINVLVSSLHPDYVKTLLVLSNTRDIQYVAATPVNKGELDKEFEENGTVLVKQVTDALMAKKKCSLNPLNERILPSMHLFAAGHQCTVKHLKDNVEDGIVLAYVKKLLICQYPVNPYHIMTAPSAHRILSSPS